MADQWGGDTHWKWLCMREKKGSQIKIRAPCVPILVVVVVMNPMIGYDGRG